MGEPNCASYDQPAHDLPVSHVPSKATDELCRDIPFDELRRQLLAEKLPEDEDSFYVDGCRRLLDIHRRRMGMDACEGL